MYKIYRYRVKSMTGELNRQARACNLVWNFCNDTQKHALKWNKKWPTWVDLGKLTSGSSVELGIHSNTIAAICAQYWKSRKQQNRPYIRYRGKRSLGWIPIKGPDIKRDGMGFRFLGKTYKVFNSQPLPDGKIKDGTSFSQDSKGNWFLNITIEVAEEAKRSPVNVVGIDLGLKDLATFSNGEKIENPRHLRQLERRLAQAQRARKRLSIWDRCWIAPVLEWDAIWRST